MKFTCDNCGAQYLIADTKLGDRGVKVRCKKCSYVIILRPPGWSGAKKEGDQAPQSADLDLPKPSSEAPTSIAAEPAAEEQAVASGSEFPSPDVLSGDLAATSSDMGLSQEFAALGFSDDAPAKGESGSPSLSVGLDVDKVSIGTDSSSPFSSGSVGGSLDYVPAPSAPSLNLSETAGTHASDRPESDATEVLPRNGGGLGASSPPVEAAGDSTRVDAVPSVLSPTESVTSPDLDDFGDEGTQLDRGRAAGAGSPPIGEENTDGDALAALKAAAEGEADAALPTFSPPPGVEEDQHSGGSAASSLEALASEVGDEHSPEASTGEIDVALAGVEKNELLDMQSSLENELEGLSDSLDWDGNEAADDPEPGTDNLSALNALASDSESAEEPGDYDGFAQARAEQEIGSAFEAMFGGAEGEEVAGAGDNLPNNVETRVFDVEAMQQVEAEQEMARPAGVKEEEAEWYVAIDDNQVGPITVTEVVDKWEAGDLAADSLCWRQGMADWQPIKLTAELRVHLGSMEDRERTVVTALEVNEDEDSMVDESPPQISITPESRPESAQPMAASGGYGGGETAMEEPSWRPGAANALASLAAEELSSVASPPAKQQDDVAVGAALPATSDALEKLLQGGSAKASEASQFGAAEKSESVVRPLPRRAETVSSIPLRDPVAERSRNNWVMPVSILGGAIVLAGALVAIFSGDGGNQPEKTAAAGMQAGQVAMVEKPGQAAQPETAKAPPAAPVKKVEEPEKKAPEPEPVKADDEEEKKAKPKAKEEDEKAESEDADKPKKKRPKRRPKRRTRRRAERRETVSRPPPAPPPRRPRNEVDDLLAPADRRRPARRRAALEPDVPRQLDDSDILGVLRKHRKAIISCVKKQQTADGSVSGTMMVNLVIKRSGRTSRITVSPSRFRRSVAGRCVSSAVKRWRFPKFSGPSMPIDFPVRIR